MPGVALKKQRDASARGINLVVKIAGKALRVKVERNKDGSGILEG